MYMCISLRSCRHSKVAVRDVMLYMATLSSDRFSSSG